MAVEPRAWVFQVSSSPGGVPKLPRAFDEVAELGLASDAQRHLKVHGGPRRAVCLYGLERILALQAEGHPIYPGAVGENLTLVGLDWREVIPGRLLRIGDAIEPELRSYTVPCATIAAAFADGDSRRIDQERHPGWSRLYASVRRGGRVRPGDPVSLH